MELITAVKPCSCCKSEYVWDPKKWLTEPGLCLVCEGNQCIYCGEFVSPRDRSKTTKDALHKACDVEWSKPL